MYNTQNLQINYKSNNLYQIPLNTSSYLSLLTLRHKIFKKQTYMRPWTVVQVYWFNWTIEPIRKFPSLTKWLIWVPSIACCKCDPSDRTSRNRSLCCGCFVCTCFKSVTCSVGFSSAEVAPPLVILDIAPSVRFMVEKGGVSERRENERKLSFLNRKP